MRFFFLMLGIYTSQNLSFIAPPCLLLVPWVFFFPTVIICCFSSFNFVFALAYYSSQFVLCSFHVCICEQHFNKFSFNQIVCDNSYMVVQLLCNMYKWTVLWTFCQFRFFFCSGPTFLFQHVYIMQSRKSVFPLVTKENAQI